MIGGVVSGRLFQQAWRLMDEAEVEPEQRASVNLEAFDVEIPQLQNVKADFSTAAPLLLASRLNRSPGEVAAELSTRVMETEPREAFAKLISQAAPTDNGYINFSVAELGLQEWFLLIAASAKELEPRDFGRIIRAIPQLEGERPDLEKIEAITSTGHRCAKLIKDAKQPRFDVENKTELPPLFDSPSESAFLRTCIDRLSDLLIKQNEEFHPQTAFAGLDRKLLVSAGLLVDDLIQGGAVKSTGGGATNFRSHRALRHAYDLSCAAETFLNNNSVANPNHEVTRLHLLLILASGRLLAFCNAVMEFVTQKLIAKAY